MSKIEVDAIVPQSGTNLTVGESGDTITVPSGATFDASNATTTLPATVVTTDGSQTLTNKTIDASQLTGTITPSDNTVSLAKLTATGTKDATTFLRGDNTFAEAGGGKVLQVVQGTYKTQGSTTSTSYVATGLSVNITPSSTSSKILVTVHGNMEHTSADQRGDYTIYRDSTNLATSGANSVDSFTTGNDRNNGEVFPVAMQFLDSPSTTSQITYAAYHKSAAGSTIYFVRFGVGVITAIEIGA